MQWFDAARKGDVAELQRHLKSGQDVNAKGGKGSTALLMAAGAGLTPAVKLLLQHGADANVHAKGIGRPLTVAIENEHWDTAAALVDGGANPNHGGVATSVITDKKADLLKRMLQRGLDPNGKHTMFGNYLKYAVDSAYSDNVYEASFMGQRSTTKGDLRCLEALLDAGGDLKKAEAETGETVLFTPVVANDEKTIRRLLKAGADINLPIEKSDGKTALMWLAETEETEKMIRLLVDLGAELEATDENGKTALKYAERTKATKANADLLRKLGAGGGKSGKGKKEKATKQKKPKKEKVDDRDPLERQPFESRRGTLAAFDYNSWEATSIYVGGPGGIDAVAKSLSKAKRVGVVEADVTRAALAGKLDQPDAPHVIIVKLKGHDWAPVSASFAKSYDMDAWKDLSRDANTRVIWCGHQDTAGATGFDMFEGGQAKIEFESCGEEYGAESEDDLDNIEFGTRFKSASHKKDWWQQHENEDETLQALVKEQDAFVPMFMAYADKGKLKFQSYPEDALDPENVERIVLAVYGPASKAKPDPTGKQLLEAIEKLDVAGVEKAIAAGADLNFLPGESDNAISHAVERALKDPAKGVPVIEALLRAGAEVNNGGEGQNAPLWHAFDMCFADLHEKIPVLQALIRAGADLNRRAVTSYMKGRTPLGVAAGSGDMEMTEFLIANGADPAATDANGKTARQSAQATVKRILKMTDDDEGEHTGPIKKVIKYLERVEKGEMKPAAAAAEEKDWQKVIADDKAEAEARAAKMKQAFADLGEMFKQLGAVERAEKRGDEKAMRKAAAKVATLAQPMTIDLNKVGDEGSEWHDEAKRHAAVAALEQRGFEPVGTFEIEQFDDFRMIALLHKKQHVYAAVCEMSGQSWLDLVQYYSDGTQLNATNAKSAGEAQVDVPGQRKYRQPKWNAAKLGDWILKESPPKGAKVQPLKAKHFATHFVEDYQREMQQRRGG